MPRYFFHIYHDVETHDEEGEELANLEAVRSEALEAARAMICRSVRKGHINLHHRIEVTDEQGKCVLALPFRGAFTISG